jgi:hypothetical protein
VPEQANGIADPDCSGLSDISVESKTTIEPLVDVAQNLAIDFQGVGINGCHRATTSERVEPNNRITNVKFSTRPVDLIEALDALDQDVRPQATHIAPERINRTIGSNQQRKYVESIWLAASFQPRIVTRSVADLFEHFRRVPIQPIHKGVTIGIKRGMKSQKPMMPP